MRALRALREIDLISRKARKARREDRRAKKMRILNLSVILLALCTACLAQDVHLSTVPDPVYKVADVKLDVERVIGVHGPPSTREELRQGVAEKKKTENQKVGSR